MVLIGGCSQQNGPNEPTTGTFKNPPARSSQPVSAPAVRLPAPRRPASAAEEKLHTTIQRLGENFDGQLGIAIGDLESGWIAHFNGDSYFPQQSVSKLWVALAVLDQADQGKLELSQEVTLRRDDLTLFYQPIRPLVLRPQGYTVTLGDLLERALVRSDNTANDYLLRRLGGPQAVRKVLEEKGIAEVRFGPGERELQSDIAGLQWKQEYALGRAFVEARDEVPTDKRRAAFESYLKDPVDGATPIGIATALGRLEEGQLLSAASTKLLLSILSRTRSGPRRLKGGLESGWSIAHKTGTGQILDGSQAGYNDVGLMTSPDGKAYSVAVLIGRTKRPLRERMALMQDAVRAVIRYDRELEP